MPESSASRDARQIAKYTWRTFRGANLQQEFHMRIPLPETYQVDEPSRVTVTQTRGGAWVDHFGAGIGSLTMSGTTGFGLIRNPNKGQASADMRDGFERWKDLKSFFLAFESAARNEPTADVSMEFYNWTQEDYYQVMPVGLPRLDRNVSQPLLFRYTIAMQLLRRLDKEGYRAERDTLIEQLGTNTKRAQVIGQRLQAQLETQWEQILQEIKNSAAVPVLTDAQKDAFTQQFVSSILDHYGAPAIVTTTDPSMGVVSRTRTLAEKITDYANAKTAFIGSTLQEVRAIAQGWRDVIDALDYALTLPASYAREVRETLCVVQSLLLYPQLFRSTALGTFTDLSDLLLDSGCATSFNL